MNDEYLQMLLRDADKRFRRACATGSATTDLLTTIYRRRAAQKRRRKTIAALAVFAVFAGMTTMWSLERFWQADPDPFGLVAVGAGQEERVHGDLPAQGRRAPEEEIARLRADIADLEAEAKQAQRFVELYQAAEARKQTLARTNAGVSQTLLTTEALAELEIDRAAAITVAFADAQANLFNRPADAARAYRSALEHFPDSRWAAVARQRLSNIQMMN